MVDIKPFIHLGHERLNPYISGVAGFLERLDRPGGLEKTPLRSKPPDVYIRNMLAVGVLNRLHRSAFLETTRRVLVMPDCLKNYGGEVCCKGDLGNAYECTQCNAGCLVFETVERFASDHTSVVLEPEDMSAYFADLRQRYGTVGIVGVACVLTMMSGFERTMKNKLPTQGVFLNYSSCAHHWADPPYNTSYSFNRMAFVLRRDPAGEPDRLHGRGETYSMEKQSLSPDDFYRRLDELAAVFERDYLAAFRAISSDGDLFELSYAIRQALVPDLITRDSA